MTKIALAESGGIAFQYAIRENCQSQQQMDLVEIDCVLQALSLAEQKSLCDQPLLLPKRRYRRRKKKIDG